MKQLFKSIHPKHLFTQAKKPKKSHSISKSSPPSFGSTSSSTTTTSSSSSSSSSTTTSSSAFHFDVVSAFNILDRDGNGKIDRYELKPLFKKSLTDAELEAMIKEIDVDGDGCITLDELQAVGNLFDSTANDEDELRAAFEFFDADNDGKISALELFHGFVKIGDDRCTLDDCRRMIESVDVNKDGFVCFHDFSRMMEVNVR